MHIPEFVSLLLFSCSLLHGVGLATRADACFPNTVSTLSNHVVLTGTYSSR